uniref:Tudor domain containing 6 n=1 Tax=Mastacembelus armatus TaxID=205130 RepID=A0A3Q3LN41_9TELE
MSSIPGLPTQGSDVTILITRVHLHPLCVLVEFWGKFSQERTAEYESLSKDIQSPGNTFQEFEGNLGDQCLVQIDGTWYRARIVSRNGTKYTVFLIDKGMTCGTTTNKLAWAKKEHFILPPEVEFCVLANVLPLSPENRWSPVALEFLKSLSGKCVKAHVQNVLVPHRTFLLHIPCIATQMYEMGFSRKLRPDVFQDFVLKSLQSQSGTQVSPNTQLSMGAGERLHKELIFMYPELPEGTVETVIVTEVTNPQRIFCQLKVFSQELKKLSEQLKQCCEGRSTRCIVGPEMIGFPCAARGSDGKWYRSVLQQVFPTNKMVEVLHVDYGTKQFIQVENLRPMAAEFFRMPVVTYVCSLYGIIDRGVGWKTRQIDYLRNLLLCKTVIAKFEYQSISEGVHYVTLYGDENTNINNLFGSKESCLLECETPQGDYAICSPAYSYKNPSQQERNRRKMLTLGEPGEEKECQEVLEKFPAQDLSLNSSHMAVVKHVSSPSEFWIQTRNYTNELDELMDNMYHLYRCSEDEVRPVVVSNPFVGLYCAAKAENDDFYRATVSEVGETQIKVFFVDYGNTEVVDRLNIKTLPNELKKLPWLALKCSLAGVRPKDGKWSQKACEFFIRAVTDKVLNIHVTTKHDDSYVVQITDPKALGERDLSTLMCSSNFAERVETQSQPKAKMTMQPAILLPRNHTEARLSSGYRNNGIAFQNQNTAGPAGSERTPTFKELMFPIGSVLDVTVSYIKSPNDFWCQLVQNTGHLKLLMRDIQAYYANSESQPLVETACVARHPDNGMWYRALVIHKDETAQVDVLFVDYGQTETVSLCDLRRISPEFLTLQGQAFRCSLLNPFNPTSAINEWNDEATARFNTFVETAASNFVILKCTIYAVMYSEQRIVYNIVDLETPFESVCTSMVNLVKSAPPKTASKPSFRLDTYYYSTHNIKTGTEEQVTVTCVNSVNQFFCQLERNADVMKDLKIKVSNLCHQLENVKLPTVFGTLCFAKYTDGQWYRGQIKATKPAVLVHFVDYGDTIEVGKSDLLPVPREANDIMSVPVQAVVCALSDVPANVSSEVNGWFEASATECKFRALVVAKEPDGKLLVELYHGNTQINSEIKKMFQIEMHTQGGVVYQRWKTLESSAKHVQRTPKQAREMENHTKTSSQTASKPADHIGDEPKPADTNLLKLPHHILENGQKVKAPQMKLYRPPRQRQSCGKTGSGCELEGAHAKPKGENLPTNTTQLVTCAAVDIAFQKESKVEKLPELSDLPSTSVTKGMEADVYVSHCNSPLSFYIQLVREEDELFSVVKKLNDTKSTLTPTDVNYLHPGVIVQAEFADDTSWYRAVVKETHSNTTALVEFVDFGNTAVIPISKIGRLPESLLQLPMYSTHCMLSSAAALAEKEVLDPEVVSAFKEDIGCNEEKVLKCRFIRQSGSLWEVSLEDSGVHVTCKVPSKCLNISSDVASEKLKHVKEEPDQNTDVRRLPEKTETSLLNPCSLHYYQAEFLEGQQLEVYISSISDAQTFWCQYVDSEELDKITLALSEFGAAADHKCIDPGLLSPGSPCIALFSDDHLWYRAEVINKDGHDLSVLFVDYGNRSQVSITDVREMPSDLVETPLQAFLCELEGFDSSCGYWDSGAVNELSALLTDKLLQLTITRLTRHEEKMKCVVQVECEGQVINEVMKTWWKSSKAENKADVTGLTSSFEEPLQHESTVKEAAPPKKKLECPRSQEIDSAVTCIEPWTDHIEEQLTDKLFDPHTSSDLTTSETPADSIHVESFVLLPQEWDHNMSEYHMATGPQKSVSVEGMNIATMVISQTNPKEILANDSSIDETTSSLLDNEADQGMTFSCDKDISKTGKDPEENDALMMETVLSDESSAEEINTHNEGSTFDMIYCAPGNDSEIADARDSSVTRVTEGEMQEIEAGDGLPQEEVPCITTDIKDDEVGEVTCSVEDACLTNDCTGIKIHYRIKNKTASQACSEILSFWIINQFLFIYFFLLCTAEPNASTDDSEIKGGDDCLSGITADEMVICISIFVVYLHLCCLFFL